MSLLKSVYKVFRSIVMSLIVLLVLVYLGLYVVFSVPFIQNKVKETLSREVSALTGGSIELEGLTLNPFNEIILRDVTLDSPEGERCAAIERLAAGIDIWELLTNGKIVLNYAEIIGLKVNLEQKEEHSPINIQFLIDALSSKDKTKPETPFDLRIRNVVVRNSKITYSRPWMTDGDGRLTRWAEVEIDRLRMDLSIPVLRNDLFGFDIRNIQFEITPGVTVRGLTARVSYEKSVGNGGSDRLQVKDFKISFPNSSLELSDLELCMNSLEDISASVAGTLTPSDFHLLVPALERFSSAWNIEADASLKGRGIKIAELRMEEETSGASLLMSGAIGDYSRKDSLDIDVDEFKANLSSNFISEVMGVVPGLSVNARRALHAAGRVTLDLDGFIRKGESGEAQGSIVTDCGELDFSAAATNLNSNRPKIKLKAEAGDVDFGEFLSTDKIGKTSFDLEAEIEGYDINAEGSVRLKSDNCELVGNPMTSIDLALEKKEKKIGLTLSAISAGMKLYADGETFIDGADTKVDMEVGLEGFNPSVFGGKGKSRINEVNGKLRVNTTGNSMDNLTGMLELIQAGIKRSDGRQLNLSNLTIKIDDIGYHEPADGKAMERDICISSDWLDGHVKGIIHPDGIIRDLKGMAASVFPSLLSKSQLTGKEQADNEFSFELDIKDNPTPYAFFEAPVRPVTHMPIRGYVDGKQGKAGITVSTPHLLQGKNKLIRDVELDVELDSFLGMAKMKAGAIYPAKKGDAELSADIQAIHDKVNLNVGINPTIDSKVKGWLTLTAAIGRRPDPFKAEGILAVDVDVHPATVTVNETPWSLAESHLDYSGKKISIQDFQLSHEDQYIKIDGVASENPEDQLRVKLNDIDLEYIFNILNINYVSFGGMASGEVVGSRLLTKDPEAKTEFLHVKGLSYNGAVLGDGDLASDYDARQQMIGIYAVIRDPLTRHRRASVDGGIWVLRDSLSFGFDADRVNVGFMKPFVSAFCSDLHGEASGKCKLYGKFSDIDLVGDLKADTLSMKLDFTNTWYHAGSDSVFLHKGVIEIPPLTLYDDEGHSAEFSGWMTHTYFHNPVFNFRLKDAESLLCYDTNSQINPLWYGTIYGTGHAQINGRPGLIDIDMNMTTEEGSKFYYIISDAEDIAQYSFLSFTDKRKARVEAAAVDTVPEYLKRFRKQSESNDSGSSNVILSLKGTVTNDALVTLVMDPKAGDNITARGQGALQMDYNLASNDLRMIGTYVLDEGNYNFTLQDIIIKNFNIRKGSLIKFNGDPMNAILDIAATYRVNTNLTDLDESFASDKDLNRTNVPVDAVLLVDGQMTNPDITFDIELPSLTSDVERKVKSIVSTNDMMNRQIIYLLAMNRFYTPEYTNGQGSGSEWSSLASSTISSQLSNILSQMTDKLDVSPSFRSDKGDFTDMEFDLALSSRLLNNRLLINGNFGYRDKNTSNTQFIGDFDIEYLLSKNGNLRLKAYNHFNDQNYYLRSALTTQGVGVVFRKDFDHIFRQRKKEIMQDANKRNMTLEEPEDSVSVADREKTKEKDNK